MKHLFKCLSLGWGLLFFNGWEVACANPTGQAVVAGGASFNNNGSTLTITQTTDKLITNWQSFSIATGETTKFIQPSSSSAVLNRVVSGNPSSIFGNMEANGKVYLINPNGILVGAGAQINCNSFVGSTLDISDSEFLKGGDLNFSGTSSAKITNLGKIQASGGDVFLLARQVENYGEITADKGTVGLGSGTEILLKMGGEENVYIQAGLLPNGTGVEQQGYIRALQAEIKAGGSLAKYAINNGGHIQATQVEKVGGAVYLRTPGLVKNTGTIEAKGDVKGGKVVAEGTQIAMGGLVDVSGGEIGGSINIGGGYQGKDSSIVNAQQVKIGDGAVLRANGGTDAGAITVWSDGVTEYYGAIEAKSLSGVGLGGVAEVSGKGRLDFAGTVDLGGNGKLLLDPKNIDIDVANTKGYSSRSNGSLLDQFSDESSTTSWITPTDLLTLLNTADVTLQANTDIFLTSSVDASGGSYAGRSLTVNAGRSISFAASQILTLNGGNFTATFNDVGAVSDRTAGNASFVMSDGSGIITNGGSVSITPGTYGGSTGHVTIGGGTTVTSINTGAGSISITGKGVTSGAHGLEMNKVSLTTTNGNVSLTGTGQLSGSVYGVYMLGGSTVTTNSGTIDITGLGGGGAANNGFGVYLTDANTLVTSTAGNITVNGTGRGTGNTETGVYMLNGAQITSTGTANITVKGIGSTTAGSLNSFGVNIVNAGISSTGSGSITIQGTGGTGNSTANIGVRLNGASTLITTSGTGNISVTGTGNGTGSTEYGIYMLNGAQITSTSVGAGAGTIMVTGTGSSSGTNNNHGVYLDTGATTKISSVKGDVTVTGTGGGAGTDYGIYVYNGAKIESTGAAGITLTGSGAGTSLGINMATGANVIGGGSASGNIILNATTATAGNDMISLASGSVQTAGTITLRPVDDSTTIGIGAGASGDFNLGATDLGKLTAGSSGIVIGKTTGTGAVDLRAVSWSDNVTVLSNGSGSSGITMNGTQTMAANNTFVAASKSFNNAGANTITTSGTGRYLIYVPQENQVTKNGLGASTLYGKDYDVHPPTSIGGSGSYFLHYGSVTLTGNALTRSIGGENPDLTWSYSGLQSGDSISALTGLNLTTSATKSSPAGIYAVTLSGGRMAGYTLSYVNGSLTVNSDTTQGTLREVTEQTKLVMPVIQLSKTKLEPPNILFQAKSWDASSMNAQGVMFALSSVGSEIGVSPTPKLFDIRGLTVEQIKAMNPHKKKSSQVSDVLEY